MPNQQNPQSQSGNQNTARPQADRESNYGQQAKTRDDSDRDQDRNDKKAPLKGASAYGSKH